MGVATSGGTRASYGVHEMEQLQRVHDKYKERSTRVDQLKNELRASKIANRSQQLSRAQSQAALEAKDKEIAGMRAMLAAKDTTLAALTGKPEGGEVGGEEGGGAHSISHQPRSRYCRRLV